MTNAIIPSYQPRFGRTRPVIAVLGDSDETCAAVSAPGDHQGVRRTAPAGHTELKTLNLNATELQQLTAFLRTLSGGTAASPELLRAPAGAE